MYAFSGFRSRSSSTEHINNLQIIRLLFIKFPNDGAKCHVSHRRRIAQEVQSRAPQDGILLSILFCPVIGDGVYAA